MKDTEGQKKRGRPPREHPELRVAGVEFKPAPDAQDRLRRLFTILARVMEDRQPTAGKDPSPEEGGEEER